MAKLKREEEIIMAASHEKLESKHPAKSLKL